MDEVLWKTMMIPQQQMIIFSLASLDKHREKQNAANFLQQFKDKGYAVGLLFEPENLNQCKAISKKIQLDCFEQSPVSARYAFNYIDMVLAQDIRPSHALYVEEDKAALNVINSFGLKTTENPKSLLGSKEIFERAVQEQTQPEYRPVVRTLEIAA